MVCAISHLNLLIVSDFEIRISDLRTLHSYIRDAVFATSSIERNVSRLTHAIVASDASDR